MCRYCVEYGNGTKWYLNPDNYNPELYQNEGHMNGYSMLTGPGRNYFEVGSVAGLEDILSDYNFSGDLNIVVEKINQHSGQVVPLEDALKIIDMTPDDRFILLNCSCRRYFGQRDVNTCLFLGATIEDHLKGRPWEKDYKIITREEAKEFEKEMDKLGLVHSIWDAGVDTDGRPPIVMCHCNETDCVPTRMRAHYGVINAQRKGEYVAKVDKEACKEGCKKNPVCMSRCPFGAMRYSPLDEVVTIIVNKCFGCGLCESVCPKKAINLVDRSNYPALVDEW